MTWNGGFKAEMWNGFSWVLRYSNHYISKVECGYEGLGWGL